MGFQIAGEAFDVRAADLEQMQLVLSAPADELPQIQFVCRPGSRPLLPARNPADASRSVSVNRGAVGTRAVDGVVVAVMHLRGSG